MPFRRLSTSDHGRSQNVWEIIKEQDGTFEFFRNGQLLHRAIPPSPIAQGELARRSFSEGGPSSPAANDWLEDQLAQYGFCGEEFREIRRKLDESGRARIVL